jgi:hypothetical protein
MPPGQLRLVGPAAGICVCIGSATGDKHGLHARMLLLDVPLGETGIVAGNSPILPVERDAMAGATEHDCAKAAIRPVDAEYRHVAVDRALRIGSHAAALAVLVDQAAVHNKIPGSAYSPSKPRWFQIGNRRGRQVGDLSLQLVRVSVDNLALVVGQLEPIGVPDAEHRASMGVGRGELNLMTFESRLLSDLPAKLFAKRSPKEEQVGGHQQSPVTVPVFDHHGLGAQLVKDALRHSRTVARHGDWLFGRYFRASQAHMPLRPGSGYFVRGE